MRYEDIIAATREAELESTKARQDFERTGNPACLDRVAEVEARLDRLAMTDPTED